LHNQCCDPIVELLLSFAGIDVDACDGAAVQIAAARGKQHILARMLDDLGANIHAIGGPYGSILQAAAVSGNTRILGHVLEPSRCADVNLKGGEFGTPLIAAVAHGHIEAVRMLLRSGADVNIAPVGRYGSALNAVAMQFKEKKGEEAQPFLEIREMLVEQAGGEMNLGPPVDMQYLRHRWLLLPSGWGWVQEGET